MRFTLLQSSTNMFGQSTITAVNRAVRTVHREDYLPPDQRSRAGTDAPLPIGFEQTISQPSLVEEMTRELALQASSRVLEIGTGSGYQTAILAEIAESVFTIERIPQLAETARRCLEEHGYRNIQYRVGDGSFGWPEAAPFDAIIVTAAPTEVPATLVEQLARSGRMIVPVGPDPASQQLLLITKDAAGKTWQRELFGVRFVPLVRDQLD